MSGETSGPGLFVILIGPSGAGKSTLLKAYLSADPTAVRVLSCTTRPPRAGEQDGVDYHFLSDSEFSRRRAAGTFLEYAQVFGRHGYATPREEVLTVVGAGRIAIKDVDVQGASQIRKAMPEAVQVFVAPSTLTEIERRLRDRATESEDAIRRRLAEAERELPYAERCDHRIANDDLGAALAELTAVIASERRRRG
ncbi:guanylate kinase [Planctomycetota bacterium]|nr:guanylate kinase [Planctomycetota bacterium]